MLTSIWSMRTEMQYEHDAVVADVPKPAPVEKLPAQSLIVPPQPQTVRLAELVEKRRALAA